MRLALVFILGTAPLTSQSAAEPSVPQQSATLAATQTSGGGGSAGIIGKRRVATVPNHGGVGPAQGTGG